MAQGPRIVSEVQIPDMPQPSPEVTDVAATVQALHQPRPTPPQRPTQQRAPSNLAQVYHAIALVIGARLMSLTLVAAMVVLSYMAVSDPLPLRLWAAGGFDTFALAGLWLLNGRA